MHRLIGETEAENREETGQTVGTAGINPERLTHVLVFIWLTLLSWKPNPGSGLNEANGKTSIYVNRAKIWDFSLSSALYRFVPL